MILVADIGGTRARFALSDGPGRLGPVREFATGEQPFAEILNTAVADLAPPMPVSALAVAAAGPVVDGRVRLTNAGWTLDAAEIAAATGIPGVTLVNDFAAVARALPMLGAADVRAFNAADAAPGAAMVVLGPGTGLGVAAAVPAGAGDWHVVGGEGGHVTLAARTGEEDAILTRLRARFGHVSAERVLSGAGLALLHEIRNGDRLAAAEIARGAKAGWPASLTTVHVFTDFLAGVAADAALTLGARGGVFLTGGVLDGLGPALEPARFMKRFADKGRFSDYLAQVPVAHIRHPYPGLLGLSALAPREGGGGRGD